MTGVLILIRDKLADGVFKKKLLHTLSLFFCFMALGMTGSMTGPALLDLQLITNTNTEQASLFITGASVGSMVGSLVIGFLFGRWNKALMMSSLALGIAVTLIAMPWCSIYILMIIIHGVVAMFVLAFSTGVTVDVVRTWAPDSRVYLQIQNTCFSVGGAIAPLIVQPFLAPRTQTNVTSVSGNSNSADSLILIHVDNLTEGVDPVVSVVSNATNYEETPTTHIQYAYLIPGVWFLVGACIFFIQRDGWEEKESLTQSSGIYETLDKPLPKAVFLTTMIFHFFLFFFLISVQASMAAFLVTFAVTYLDWTKQHGANLTTVYWLCHASGRFIVIFLTNFVSPFKFLLVSSCVTLIAMIGIAFSSLNHYETGIWICTGVFGLFISSQAPSLMMWTEESILRLTPKIVSFFSFATSSHGIVVPQILGYLMQEVTPMWLFYLNLIQCIAMFVLLLVLYAWARLVVQPVHGGQYLAETWNRSYASSNDRA